MRGSQCRSANFKAKVGQSPLLAPPAPGAPRASLITTPYFAFIPNAVVTTPDANLLTRLGEALERNPGIDVVGTNMIDPTTGTISLGCRNMQLCHWTLLIEYRYYCGDRNLMRCDTTSPFFVARAKHFPLLDAALVTSGPLLAHLDFFHKLKHRRGPEKTGLGKGSKHSGPSGKSAQSKGGVKASQSQPERRSNAAVVVTAMDEQVSFAWTADDDSRSRSSSPHSPPHHRTPHYWNSTTAALSFVKRYAVTQIKDLDGESGLLPRGSGLLPPPLPVLTSAAKQKQPQRPTATTLDLCEANTGGTASPSDVDNTDVDNTAVQASVGQRLICDGRLHEAVMGKHWQHLGTSMPIYFYERYGEAVREASVFLAKHNVKHVVMTGSNLGFLKYGRMLPVNGRREERHSCVPVCMCACVLCTSYWVLFIIA